MSNKFLDISKIVLTTVLLILLSLFLCITLQLGPPSVEAIPFGVQPVAKGGTGATNTTDARTNLGLVIGTHVQAQNAYLTSWAGDLAGFTPIMGDIFYYADSGDWVHLDANDGNKAGYVLQLVGIDETGICDGAGNPYGCCTAANEGNCSLATWVNTLNIGSIVLPNSNNPSGTTEADAQWDSNNDMLTIGDGAARRVVATAVKCFEPACFYEPDVLDASTEPGGGVFAVKDFDIAQFGGTDNTTAVFTVTAIKVTTSATCTSAIAIEEWSDNGTAWTEDATVDAFTLSGVSTVETTISNPTIETNDVIMIDLNATMCAVDWLCVTICGTQTVVN